MIRTLYLTISTLILVGSLVGSFVISIYFFGVALIVIYCICALLSLVVSFTFGIRGITDGEVDSVITFPFGLLTFGFKRVYYSDLGYFWIRKTGSGKVYLYEQKLFVMYKIGEAFWGNDIESLKSQIKNKLEEIYKEKIKQKRQKDLEKKIWKDWDGSVDKKSRRDNKLNELGI